MTDDNGKASGSSQPTSFWLDPETRATLDKLVLKLGISRSAIVREAIRSMAEDDAMIDIRLLVGELYRKVAHE